jgi:hypothetical protein
VIFAPQGLHPIGVLDAPVVLKTTQNDSRITINTLCKGSNGSAREVPFVPTHEVLIELRVD